MRRVTVTLPQELVDVLHDMSEDGRISVSEAVREALHHYLFDERWKSIGKVAKRELERRKTNQQVLEIVKNRVPRRFDELGIDQLVPIEASPD